MGRWGSLPLPSTSTFLPNAAATGSKKRKVEPLSLQSITASSSFCSTGNTLILSPCRRKSAPNACKH